MLHICVHFTMQKNFHSSRSFNCKNKYTNAILQQYCNSQQPSSHIKQSFFAFFFFLRNILSVFFLSFLWVLMIKVYLHWNREKRCVFKCTHYQSSIYCVWYEMNSGLFYSLFQVSPLVSSHQRYFWKYQTIFSTIVSKCNKQYNCVLKKVCFLKETFWYWKY